MNNSVNYQETYLYKFRTLSNLLEKVFDRTLRTRANITLSQFMLLMAIAQQAGINQRHIAHYLGISAAAVKRQADTAKQRAWVEVIAHSARGEALYLTNEGHKALQRGVSALEQDVFHVFDHHNRSANLMQHLDLLLENTKTISG